MKRIFFLMLTIAFISCNSGGEDRKKEIDETSSEMDTVRRKTPEPDSIKQKKEITNVHKPDIPDEQIPEGASGVIPENVQKYIAGNLPGWKVPDTSEYIKPWWVFYNLGQITYYVTADFNEDGLSDHVLTMKKDNTLHLVFLIGQNGSFYHWIPEDFSYSYQGKNLKYGILLQKSGQVDRVVDNESVSLILEKDGISLRYEEFISKIYYWEDGSFKVFRAR